MEEGLELRRLEGLGVELALPPGWRQIGGGELECPRCGEAMPGAKEKRSCPGCGREVKPREPPRALFSALSDGRRRVQVVSFPRGPFDGPDTTVVRTLAHLEKNPGGFEDLVQLEERSFQGALGLGHLAVLETRLGGGRDRLVYRMYGFVGPKRTVRIDALHPPRADPREEAAEVALFDAIAASVKELP